MTVDDAVHDTLAQYTDDYAVERELHAVPPYRVHEVRVDGRRAVLKRDAHRRGHAAVEGHVHAYAAAETRVPVPPVLAVGADHYLVAWDDTVPDEPPEPDTAWCRAAGVVLARLHADSADAVSTYGSFTTASDADATTTDGDHTASVADATTTCVANDLDGPRMGIADDSDGTRRSSTGTELSLGSSDGVALVVDGATTWCEAVCDRLRGHRQYLASRERSAAVARADAVLDYLAATPDAFAAVGEPVCCHGNVLPDHLGVVDGSPASLIDFEHALAAPPGYDYWRTVGPLGGDDEPALVTAFREGYESVRPLPTGARGCARAYRLVNAVAYLEALFLQRNRDETERERVAERLCDAIDEWLAAARADGDETTDG
ncbi:phosphotransferase [Halobaculum sp. MBLA0147]|uniref:phosphotransferase n=1 Tax=Halobaculum sp. MBLA0147 TaxID=3079934 RepID=UPI0035243E51